MALLNQIIQILVGGLTEFAKGLGSGINQFVTNVFTNETGESLTVFGSVTIVFAGIALAIGLSKFIVNWVSSLGK